MPPREILYVEGNRDGTVGGSHRALFDMVRYLDRSRFRPSVVFYERNPYVELMRRRGVESAIFERGRLEGGARRSFASKVADSLSALPRQIAFLRGRRIDLVHLNNSPSVSFDDWLPACLLLRIPCVSHARGADDYRPSAPGRWLLRRFGRVIAVSQAMANAAVRAGVSPERIEVVHDGIDAGELRSRVVRPAGEVRGALGLGADSVMAVMVGHLRSWKGQDVALEALRRLPSPVREKLRMLFVGEAPRGEEPYRARLEELVRSEGLGQAARFLGARSDVPDLLAAADIVVQASTLPEPFGLVVLEGMVFGKPVIASRLGGPSEIVRTGEGILFDPTRPEELAESLCQLVSDSDLRGRLGEAGRLRAADFDVRRTAERVSAVYDELLAGRTARE